MTAARGAHARRRVKNKNTSGILSRLVVVAVVLAGVGIMSYPTVAAWTASVTQSRQIGAYEGDVSGFDEETREAIIAEAHSYNAELNNEGAFDPYSSNASAINAGNYQRYLETLEGVPSGVMGRIRIPKIATDLPIYHGTDDVTLLKGVGHLYGTALPVGGEGTHAVLTGHSGLADATMFTGLQQLDPGDFFQVESYGHRVSYEVVDIATIDPTETDSLVPQANRDLVSLVTCTPIGVNTHRLVVTGQRVPNPPDPSELLPEQDIPGFPWWVVWTVAAILWAAVYLAMALVQRKRMPEPSEAAIRAAVLEDPSPESVG